MSVNTIADLENGREMPIPAKLAALRQAFSSNGQRTLRFAKSGVCGWLDLEDGGPLLMRTQCRAARALLGWDRNDLAKRTNGAVSANTIERFENGQSRAIRATQKALLEAFRAAGVRFTEEREQPSWCPTQWVALTTGADKA